MNIRKNLVASVSLMVLTIAGGSAQAQSTTAPSPDANEDEIVVTGFRASVEAAIDAKRNSTVIADVVTAEDIGKFPDRNVAEALQRVPGIVINREFGEGERVSLRGTAPNLTKTLVNGHSIATADWFVLDQLAATRSFNYLTLPSEIVGKLEVYKSPQADIEEGGIGGTINVHTRDPLAMKAWTIAGSAQAVYSDRSDKVNPQFSGVVSWKNADETFGILLGAVYQKREIRRDGVEVLGYQAYNVSPTISTPGPNPGDPAVVTPNPGYNPALAGTQFPSLIGSALFQQKRERYGGNVALHFRPSDKFEVSITGLYSKFNANNINANFLAWGSNAIGGGGTITNPTVVDGTIVKGTVTSTPGGRAAVYDVIDRLAVAEVGSGDVDIIWRPSEQSTLHLKGGYTQATGKTDAQPFYEGGAPGAFTYDLTGRTPQVSFTGFNPANPADLPFDFASLHRIVNSDSEFYTYADFEQKIDSGFLKAIKIGAKFTDHNRETSFMATTYGSFYLGLAQQFVPAVPATQTTPGSPAIPASTACGGAPCTSAFFAGGSLPSDFLKNIALPGTLTKFFTIDRAKLESVFFGLPAANRARLRLPGENFTINEKTYGGYAMADFGNGPLNGNVGVRVVRTEQTSTGDITGVSANVPGAIANLFGPYIPSTVKKSYTDVLPSINVSYDVSDQVKIRAAAGRTIARADYTDIVPRVSLNPGSLSATAGNPNLDPYRANQADLSLEWYPTRGAIIAAALYYKDIKSYIVNRLASGVFPVETSTPNLGACTAIPGSNPNLYNCTFAVNVRSNGGGGTNKGAELQIKYPVFGGFGVDMNYTYSDAKAKSGDPIPGNSKHALNVTGYFENDLLSARLSYNYRSTFFIDFDRASPLNQKATDSLDASLGIAITPNIRLTADAINLTNTKIVQFSGTEVRPRAIYDNGRQFYAGVRVKF